LIEGVPDELLDVLHLGDIIPSVLIDLLECYIFMDLCCI
jgi:hypothetical protein